MMKSVRGNEGETDEPEKLMDVRCKIIKWFMAAVVITGIIFGISYFFLKGEVPTVDRELEYMDQLAEWGLQPIVEMKVSEVGGWCG